MKEFERYHPLVNFLFFCAVIGLSMFFMHPVSLCISLCVGFLYSVMLNGKKTALFGVLGIAPMLIAAALLNPVFNHQGITILTYLPDGNPLTLESVVYGISAASMLASVVCWFSCYNAVMTSDKFMCLFGKVIPSLSLVFSMTLRFVPRFREQFKAVSTAQKGLGCDLSEGSFMRRLSSGIKVLSIMTTWILESSVETANSMKSRGYGLRGRSSFSLFVLSRRDWAALIFLVAAIAYILVGCCFGGMYFSYFPSLVSVEISWLSVSVFAVYFTLCAMPIFLEIWEVCRWNALKSKI